jgi:hypothetical protein
MASFKCSECVAKCICKVQKFDPLCDEFRQKLADTAEALKPSHNTGSPKLPSLEECLEEFGVNHELWSDGQRLTHSYVTKVYEFIARQLRAGA